MELTAAMIDADWAYFTPKIAVKYIPYDVTTDANIEGSTVYGIDAIIQEYTKEESPSDDDVAYHRTRIWNLRATHLKGTKITKRGIIEEPDGTQWVVESAVLKTIGTRWNCRCFALVG